MFLLNPNNGGSGGSGTVNTNASLQGDGSVGNPLRLNLANENTWTAQQFNTSIFRNNSNLDWSTNNVTIGAAGSDGGGAWIGFQWNHTDSKVYLQDELGALFDLGVDTLYANDSIVSNQITTNQFIGSTITATGSGGLLLESNSGTDVALFGAGGGSGATFYGGVNIAGNLAVDTNTLFVDSTNDKVGIRNTTPVTSLEISGSSLGHGAIVQNAFIGTWAGGSTYAVFANSTFRSTNNSYAMIQDNLGNSFFNAASGRFISFRINNSEAMIINSSSQLILPSTISTSGGTIGRFIMRGEGTSTASPVLVIAHDTNDSAVKNAGIFTRTRMTSRYLATMQNIGNNDNSFGNAGVVNWTAWEYSDSGYTTLVTPTELKGWNYQYWNGSAYKQLLKVGISGIGIGMSAIGTVPSAKLHVIEDNTLGNEVFRIESVATNDDPSERVFQNRVATTDGTVTTLHTVTIASNTTYTIEADIVARRTGGTAGTAQDGASYKVIATVKNVSGTATIIGAVNQLVVQEDQAGWGGTIDVTSNTARVRVTGATDNNITWHLTLRTRQVSS